MNLKSLSEGVVLSLWACEQQLELSLLSIFFCPTKGLALSLKRIPAIASAVKAHPANSVFAPYLNWFEHDNSTISPSCLPGY
jgi:hypothetical protein